MRYLDSSGIGRRFHRLKSVRELGGHVVHSTLAKVVRAVANGDRISDHPDAGKIALREFDRIATASAALPPWKLLHECQIAELHNGQTADDEISHWREIIPLCVKNGRRVMYMMDFRTDAGERRMLAEQEFRFLKSEREHRGIIDVLLHDGKNRTVIDWKCHSISNTDVRQVHFYQDHLSRAEGVPYSRLYGFVVDLLREEIMPAHFRPLNVILERPVRLLSAPRASSDPYPARASLANCGRCPFAAICADSAIRPTTSLPLLEEVA